jgi:hypothetical protein
MAKKKYKYIEYDLQSNDYSEIDETNTTSAGGEYSTPNAFSKSPMSKQDRERLKTRIPTGYEPAAEYGNIYEVLKGIKRTIKSINNLL